MAQFVGLSLSHVQGVGVEYFAVEYFPLFFFAVVIVGVVMVTVLPEVVFHVHPLLSA